MHSINTSESMSKIKEFKSKIMSEMGQVKEKLNNFTENRKQV